MSTMESLHLSLDNMNGEVQRLEAENCKLREEYPERVAKVDLATEEARLVAQLKAAEGQGEPQAGISLVRPRKHLRKSLVEAASATEPTELGSTPRSTGSSLVSAAAEAEGSIASHAMLANQVPPLATYSGEDRDGVTFSDRRESLS